MLLSGQCKELLQGGLLFGERIVHNTYTAVLQPATIGQGLQQFVTTVQGGGIDILLCASGWLATAD
jgi:hypothetical protein